MIFDRAVKTTKLGKDSLFNKWWWENCIPKCKRMKLDTYLTPYTKITQNGLKGFPGGAVVKNLPAKAGDTGSSPGPGRSHTPQSN